MMSIFAKSVALAGLIAASSVVGESVRAVPSSDARQQQQRRLDDNLCLMCELCDALSDLCDFGIIEDFACITCDDDDDGGDDPDTDVCFSGLATIQVRSGSMEEITVQMKDLQVGDQILTSRNKYDTVYAFGHNNPTRTASFYQIYNEQSINPLEITADHMVFLHNKQTPVAASTLRVGDMLTSSSGPSKVTKISTVERNGVYAPLTTGGTLLVDGVKASSYIAVSQQQSKQQSSLLSDHNLIHVTLSPYRMVCTGISQHFCKPESYNDDGMPYYVDFGLNLLHWMNSNSSVLQGLVFAVVVALTGALFALELLFGSSSAPLMVFIAAVAYISQRNNKKNKAKVV